MTSTFTLGQGIFTPVEVAKILNIEKGKIRYWVKNYLKDRFKNQTNHTYTQSVGSNTEVLNFFGLIETFIFYQLKAKGISAKRIVSAHETISKALDTPYPFASQSLLVSGGNIFFEHKENLISADPKLQYSLKEIIVQFAEKIDFGSNGMAMQYFPLGKDRAVVVSPNHQFGAPTIKGTNISVEVIWDLFDAGDSKEFISSLYKIPLETVEDAIEFARAA